MARNAIEQVALLTGRVLHHGTGEPILGRVGITAKEGPFEDKLLDDGTFVLSGHPPLLFPVAPTPANFAVNLTVHANSPQFRKGVFEQPVTANLVLTNFNFASPISLGTLLVPAQRAQLDPVQIRGRVVEASLPDTGIPGVQVTVNEGANLIAQTNTVLNGLYTLGPLIVVAPATITCTLGTRSVSRPLRIDYTSMVHEEYFRLP